MKLRKLEEKDAPLMLEWMHNPTVTNNLHTIFSLKTLSDCEEFIINSWNDASNIHFAIVSDQDEYLGTVSLKHIEDGSAEFAIVVRAKVMGKGCSWFGMESIIEKAFNEYGLNNIYWCVSRNNARAVRFYDKHHFREDGNIPQDALNRYRDIENLKWYSVLKRDTIYKSK